MSGSGRDADVTLEEMLKASEQAEAQEIRAELLTLLQSDVCRSAFEAIVRKPMETTLVNALNNQALLATFREKLVASLKPELESAMKKATTESLKTINMELRKEQEDRRKKQGEITIDGA